VTFVLDLNNNKTYLSQFKISLPVVDIKAASSILCLLVNSCAVKIKAGDGKTSLNRYQLCNTTSSAAKASVQKNLPNSGQRGAGAERGVQRLSVDLQEAAIVELYVRSTSSGFLNSGPQDA
jgi:hypothetical protein